MFQTKHCKAHALNQAYNGTAFKEVRQDHTHSQCIQLNYVCADGPRQRVRCVCNDFLKELARMETDLRISIGNIFVSEWPKAKASRDGLHLLPHEQPAPLARVGALLGLSGALSLPQNTITMLRKDPHHDVRGDMPASAVEHAL